MTTRIITTTLPLGEMIARYHGADGLTGAEELRPELTEAQKNKLGAMIILWHRAMRGGAGVDNPRC